MTQINSIEKMKGPEQAFNNLPPAEINIEGKVGASVLAVAAIGSAVFTGANAERADAFLGFAGTDIQTCVDKDGDGVKETVRVPFIFQEAREFETGGVVAKVIMTPTGQPPTSLYEQPAVNLLSSPGANGSVEPAYNLPNNYNGTATQDFKAPAGEFAIYSEVSGINASLGFPFLDSSNNVLKCVDATPTTPPVEPPVVPPVITPVVPPYVPTCPVPGLVVKAPKIAKVNSKGVVTLTSSTKGAKIDGLGNGASKDPKVRNKASRVEVVVPVGVKVGKLPGHMRLIKNKVYVDVHKTDVVPGVNLLDKFPYVVKTKGVKNFIAKLVVPASVNCLASNVTSKAKSTAR